LRSVFDPERRRWIDPTAAASDRIAEVVERCPTGALHYRRKDGSADEQPADENVARIGPDGPVYVRGDLRIELPGGEVMEETRVALCRCGASDDKPFCDGSHEAAGFADPGVIRGGRLVPVEEAGGESEGPVTLRGQPDGPVLVRGPLRVEGSDGGHSAGVKGALCRCGHSGTKPFCDGSHRDAGFEAD
jgi:CDGSH-type Zn-finger protein